MGRGAGALPRVERRDRRRRGQQADRAVQPREGPLQAQVLPGARTRSSARSPTSRTTSSTTRRSSGSRSSRPTCPEPADIVERVGKYNEEQVAKFNNKEQQDLYWQLNYLLGRYKYRNGQYPEALALFEKVDRAVEVLRPGAVLRRHLERAAAPEQAGGAVVPAHPRRDRRGRRRGRGRGAHARPRVPVDGAHVLLGAASRSTSNERADRRPDALSRRGEVLEQGRRRERVLARRALRGVVGVLHGRRLQPRARQHPHDRGAVLPARRTTRRPTSSRPSSTSRTASTTTRLTIVAKFRGEVRADPRRARRRSSTSSRATNQEEAFYKFLKDVRDDKAQLDAEDRADRRRRRSRTASSSATSSTCASSTRRTARFKKAPASFQDVEGRPTS